METAVVFDATGTLWFIVDKALQLMKKKIKIYENGSNIEEKRFISFNISYLYICFIIIIYLSGLELWNILDISEYFPKGFEILKKKKFPDNSRQFRKSLLNSETK